MATPSESITTVNGKRCTRSRARTATSSSLTTEEPSVVTPTEVTTTTTPEQAPQVQTGAAVSSSPPPAAAPPTSTAPSTAAAVSSSAIGTIDVLPIQTAQSSSAADLAPAVLSPAGPRKPVANLPQFSAVAAAALTVPSTTNSDTDSTAVPIQSDFRSSLPAPFFTAPAVSNPLQTSLQATSSQPSIVPSFPSSVRTSSTTSASHPFQSGNGGGIIAPDPGSDPEGGLTISATTKVGSIVGGVVGGVASLALIYALLFFCLRRRKPRQVEWNEKTTSQPAFVRKAKAMAAGAGFFVAKFTRKKAGLTGNGSRRHSQAESISSIYSTHSNGRVRSFSEPPGVLAAGAPVRRSSSRKSERNLLRKKASSVSSLSTLGGVLEEKDKDHMNPFADPAPLLSPSQLRLNADRSLPGPSVQRSPTTGTNVPDNPFATPFDDLYVTLPTAAHKRTRSSASALSSHPPSFFYPSANLAFAKTPIGPPPRTQAAIPPHKRRSSIAYPTFSALSTVDSGISDFSNIGEPGPTRPGTSLFTPGFPTGRTVRQSDPFDLDRPEVLGFGSVVGRKEVRASVTRPPPRGQRTSSFGNIGSNTLERQDMRSSLSRPPLRGQRMSSYGSLGSALDGPYGAIARNSIDRSTSATRPAARGQRTSSFGAMGGALDDGPYGGIARNTADPRPLWSAGARR